MTDKNADLKADRPHADLVRERRAKEQENREGILRNHFETRGVPRPNRES